MDTGVTAVYVPEKVLAFRTDNPSKKRQIIIIIIIIIILDKDVLCEKIRQGYRIVTGKWREM